MRYFTIVVVSLTLAACGGSRSVDDIVVESVGGLAGSELDAGDIRSSGLDDDNAFNTSELEKSTDRDDDLLSRRVIYFDYDSSLLTPENEAIVRAHAQHLKTLPGIQVMLEGHTDERGTREYNLALGESRAKMVSRVMQALGLDSSRIQTISYGEERPTSLDSTQNAWNLNRRVEILYP